MNLCVANWDESVWQFGLRERQKRRVEKESIFMIA